MSERDSDWTPDGVDDSRPNAARMYDYFLGGAHNFDPDRQLADTLLSIAPEIRDIARANRAFLQRAVRWLAAAGVDQFLDLGSGIPTAGNVHEIVQRLDPDSRVVYVDTEPVAVAHSKLLLADQPNVEVLQADLLDPDAVLGAPEVTALLDFDRPVAILLVSVLHFFADEQRPGALVADYLSRTAPGSYLAVTHVTPNEHSEQVRSLYQHTTDRLYPRSKAEIAALLDGFPLVPPGLVRLGDWHPDTIADTAASERAASYAAIAERR
ncbi:hypothetical protein Athai_40590 [Actinocatenispora thailandica]|uniref:S-adenosyl methyltransferase n=1 Tax=Actinocatenispora thailandica TaxID=227318 RepID=A0A7R7DRV0_9ACTN|nr:SAM-dependent methyltransferase [Actinocatenispora thailandica]BCJ36556.1 hypothetical protein Athai_40590 [Actinocatenispora thailandica]